MTARRWLVWSNERGAFWRQNRHGYTRNVDEAGRFSFADAATICAEAAIGMPQLDIDGHEVPHEILMAAPEDAP